MILVTGGAFQNKKQTSCELFGIAEVDVLDGGSCGLEEIFSCRALEKFHLYVKRYLKAGKEPEKLASELTEKNPQILIVTDEIGYGIVPLEKENRYWREQTGRICCTLAAQAETVVRVVAGIPTVIKGEAKC